jgi:Zn-dependent peptidase ImmA (M78 family)
MPNLIKAQGAAFRLNKRFAVKKPGALDLDNLAMALDVLVINGGITGASGRLTRKDDEGRIRVNSNIRENGARRFTIAHELGHWELHKNESQLFLCTSADMRDYDRSPLEIEANRFASELILPSALFRPMISKVEPNLKTIGVWAEMFGASLVATSIRFIHESRKASIVVSIRNGAVEWWWKNNDLCRLWLNKGQPIRQGSVAWEIQNGNVPPESMEEVEVDSWFQHLPFSFSGEVREQSISMPRYDRIFTLLWILD